jgi:Beta-lactamase class C and other penicillin binding proteins
VSACLFIAMTSAHAEQLLDAPITPVPPLFDQAAIGRATVSLDGIVKDAFKRTGVPGLAVGVVYKDRVVYAKGFGVRTVGESAAIDPDTVFLLASVSKPIASTIVAKLVGKGLVTWSDPVRKYNSAFALHDPYVTEHATLADLLSHRSGLRTGAGDLLESLRYDRTYILAHIDQQPLDPFRSTYHYSNFGFTAGAIAASVAAGKSWEDLAKDELFTPAGMATASYRHADYLAHTNHARLHKRLGNGNWGVLYDRVPDAEAPAGGASASLNDMLRFIRLQLGDGVLDGKRILDADALAATHVPQVITGVPANPANRASFYGFGWNVSYDDHGRTQIGHSGAFSLGAATNITFLPGEDLGIVTLTNGEPIGVAEAVGAAFLDVAQNGHQTVDWISFIGGQIAKMLTPPPPAFDYTRVPTNPKPARSLAVYAGTYANSYYGPLVVSQSGDGLQMSLGPASVPTIFPLKHYDGDTFSFQTIGEDANGLAGALFTIVDNGPASRVVLDFYDKNGLGTFVRKE